VGPEGQGDDVGRQAVDDRAGLAAGAAVRLLDLDLLARLREVILGKDLVDLVPQLARGVVGDVQEFDFVLRRPGAAGDEESEKAEDQTRSHWSDLRLGVNRVAKRSWA